MKQVKLLILLFVMTLLVAFLYLFYRSEFIKTGHSRVTIENQEFFYQKKPLHLGYIFQWDGLGDPIIKDLAFIKKDGSVLHENDSQIKISPFFTNQWLGAINEELAISEGYVENYFPVEGFKVKNDQLYMVLIIQLKNQGYIDNIEKLLIKFENWKIPRYQYIEFEGFVEKEH